jgi:hypothetical protein
MAPKDKAPCLGCGKNCTGQQFCVLCTLCKLWSHKECAGISDNLFKMRELQKKETGQVFCACCSCMNFAQSITTKVHIVNQKVEELRGEVQENTDGVAKANEEVKRVEKKVEKIQRKLDSRTEESKYVQGNESQRGHQKKCDPVRRAGSGIQRHNGQGEMEADITTCEKIFKAAKASA